MSKNIMITGASSGFGRLTTETLLKNGHNVVASMRGVNGKNKSAADELKAAGAHIVEIDVTDEDSVNKGVQQAIDLMGNLDVVINNAGLGVMGLQESFTVDDWKKLFEVNVFGLQRVNRAVMPHMRKNNSGLIVFVSSLLGRITLPFYGPYNASKWAVEAMAENYRSELSAFGVDVCIVEPGGYPTNFLSSLLTPSDKSRDQSYGPMAQAPQAAMENFAQVLKSNPEQNPQDVADTMAKLVNTAAGDRPFRSIVDKMGMGASLVEYNGHLEQIMSGLFSSFGMADMLKLKTSK